MLKLKNVSQNNVILTCLGMQLLEPNEMVGLDDPVRKTQASNCSELVQFISNSIIRVIDHNDTEVEDVSLAIDLIKGFSDRPVMTKDNKIWVHQTARPLGTFTAFTSYGDDSSDCHLVGGGQPMKVVHNVGDPLTQTILVDLNVIENKTFVHEGYVMWQGGDFDTICLSVIPKITNYSQGQNTFYNLYNDYLIVPAAGDGTISIEPQDINLVEIPYSIDNPTARQSPAFWNADWNSSTRQFENISAAPEGNGKYNIFTAEVMLVRVVNIMILNDGFMKLQSSDISEITHGMRLRFGLRTNEPDHEWKAAFILTLDRVNSCSF